MMRRLQGFLVLVLVTTGTCLIYLPAGLIVAGLLLLVELLTD